MYKAKPLKDLHKTVRDIFISLSMVLLLLLALVVVYERYVDRFGYKSFLIYALLLILFGLSLFAAFISNRNVQKYEFEEWVPKFAYKVFGTRSVYYDKDSIFIYEIEEMNKRDVRFLMHELNSKSTNYNYLLADENHKKGQLIIAAVKKEDL